MGQLGKLEVNTIRAGHVLDVLRDIPDEVFQTCVTSPPYWGLRNYGVEPQVWGGDSKCNHEWDVLTRPGMSGGPSEKQRSNTGSWHSAHEHAFCIYCGAWHGSLGLEPTPDLFVDHLVGIFQEVRRVLRNDGTLWLNLGSSYAGSGVHSSRHANPGISRAGERGADVATPVTNRFKCKDLVPIPWMVAMALQQDGWWLRSDIIWAKPSCMPESVRDRPTKSHEYMFLLAKRAKYFYDQDAIRTPVKESTINRWKYPADGGGQKMSYGDEYVSRINPIIDAPGHTDELIKKGANKRTVWRISVKPYKGAHFATFPPELVEPCIKAGSAVGDLILDPFSGSGTTCMVADRLDRNYVGIDISEEYCDIARLRINMAREAAGSAQYSLPLPLPATSTL